MSIYLFMFEFRNYFIIKTKSELLIDNSQSSSSLKINVDLTMHRIPCYILNMDISDFTGAHTSNVKGTLTKTSLDIYKQLPKGYLQPTCIGAIRKKRINNLKQI